MGLNRTGFIFTPFMFGSTQKVSKLIAVQIALNIFVRIIPQMLPYLQYSTLMDQVSELLKAIPSSNKTLLTYSLHQGCFFYIPEYLLLPLIRLHTEHL